MIAIIPRYFLSFFSSTKANTLLDFYRFPAVLVVFSEATQRIMKVRSSFSAGFSSQFNTAVRLRHSFICAKNVNAGSKVKANESDIKVEVTVYGEVMKYECELERIHSRFDAYIRWKGSTELSSADGKGITAYMSRLSHLSKSKEVVRPFGPKKFSFRYTLPLSRRQKYLNFKKSTRLSRLKLSRCRLPFKRSTEASKPNVFISEHNKKKVRHWERYVHQ